MLRFIRGIFLIVGVWVGAGLAAAEQRADSAYVPSVLHPTYPRKAGPAVCIDEAHFNFHTAAGRFDPFARLLHADGYVVTSSKQAFAEAVLRECAILVIANALAERNRTDWSLPTPSAFTDEEVTTVERWVRGGGSLLLIADHMPFAGAAETLAKAFGVQYLNGYVLQADSGEGTLVFSRGRGTLADHPITRGDSEGEMIDHVASFTGSAFSSTGVIEPLLKLDASVAAFMPRVAGEFSAWTPRQPVDGWLQGGVLRHGEGRVAVFSEAGMFTAQVGADRRPMGLNAPEAKQNARFVLNLMRWLAQGLRKTNR